MDAARWEQLSQRVAAVAGRPLPPPDASGTPEFDDVMRTLRASDPQLWQEVVDVVTGHTPLPGEQEAAREQARERAAGAILSPFLRPDGLRTGRKRLNTTVILAAGAAAVIGIAFLGQQGGGDGGRRPPAGRTEQQHARVQPQPAPAPPSPPAEHPSPPAAAAPEPQATPLARRADGPSQASAAVFPQVPPLPLPPEAPPAVQAPAGSQPGTLQGAQQASPVLYREPRAATQAQQAPLLHRSRAEPGPDQQPGHVLFRAEAAGAAGGSLLYSAARQRQGQTTAQQEGNLPAEAPQGAQQAAAPTLHPGQVLQARMALPISVSPAWGAVPALAEVLDGPLSGSLLWGQARMARDGSIEISFNQVIAPGNRPVPFNGVAYDPAAGKPAIAGQVRTVTPNATQTILSSSLQAASEYFRARVESQSVTITNGFVTIRQSEPSFWDVYSRELARAMTPQTPQGSGPVVVAHLPRGTAISVIVMSEFTGK